MSEKWVEIEAKGGSMAAFQAGTGKPGIVMLQEIFGVNAAMQDKARKFAALGYTVLVPDLFPRLEPRVSLGYSEPERKKGFELFGKFDFAAGIQDIATAAKWLERSHPSVAVMGFCLGGRLAAGFDCGVSVPRGGVAVRRESRPIPSGYRLCRCRCRSTSATGTRSADGIDPQDRGAAEGQAEGRGIRYPEARSTAFSTRRAARSTHRTLHARRRSA